MLLGARPSQATPQGRRRANTTGCNLGLPKHVQEHCAESCLHPNLKASYGQQPRGPRYASGVLGAKLAAQNIYSPGSFAGKYGENWSISRLRRFILISSLIRLSPPSRDFLDQRHIIPLRQQTDLPTENFEVVLSVVLFEVVLSILNHRISLCPQDSMLSPTAAATISITWGRGRGDE